ncbi:MAG: hypothetical protein ACR2OZ_17245 [Verrucomicrobiales bacterium]
MAAANSNGAGDTINLAAGGSYTLDTVDSLANGSNGLPVINNEVAGLDLTLNGNGAIIQRSTTVGTPEFRILQVGTGAAVNVTGLTLANGKVSGSSPAYAGAGVYNNQATLGLSNCTVRQNDGRVGGGIFNHSGTVTLSGCSIMANSADTGHRSIVGNHAVEERHDAQLVIITKPKSLPIAPAKLAISLRHSENYTDGAEGSNPSLSASYFKSTG